MHAGDSKKKRTRTKPHLPHPVNADPATGKQDRHCPGFTSWLVPAIIALVTLAVYLPALKNGFVSWDDNFYVYDNTLITSLNARFLKWAFTDFTSGIWHPLTWLSYAIDHAVWGKQPFGYHLTAIVLHASNTFLVVLLAIRLMETAGTGSAPSTAATPERTTALIAGGVTGILFGIHPLHVESVAWISERKDLLYTLFYLASIMSYLHFARPRSAAETPGDSSRSRSYFLSLAFFVAAFFSKTMAVTLPVVLLLIDWYPARRLVSLQDLKQLCLEKIPFLICSLLLAAVTVFTQQAVGAMRLTEAVPLFARILVASRAVVVYLEKMVWPAGLLPIYPYPKDISLTMPEYFLPVAFIAGITIVSVKLARKWQVLPAVWLFYLVTLLPVLGLIQVGAQAMADRYTYMAALGPFLLLGVGISRVWKRAEALSKGRVVKAMVVAGGIAASAGLSAVTVNQISLWRNSIDFWTGIINSYPRGFAEPYFLRGVALGEKGFFDRAITDYTAAIELKPEYDDALVNRGLAYLEKQEFDPAIRDLSRAIALKPEAADSYLNRGNAYYKKGDFDRAMADYDVAIGKLPGNHVGYLNRGALWKKRGEHQKAIADFSMAISLQPDMASLYVQRGELYAQTGATDEATRDFAAACRLGSDVACQKAQPGSGRTTSPATSPF